VAEDTAASPVPDRGDAELENKPEFARDAKPWRKQIEQAEKAFDRYHKICDKIAKDYADSAALAGEFAERRFQMLFANMEVVKPSIYSRPPTPVVVPRFKDRKPVPRKASEILERAVISSFDTEHVHETFLKVRDDLALFGRGVCWQRYDIYQKRGETKECVRYDWIYRKDFLHEPARSRFEVGWKARGTWLTQEQGRKRFGDAWKEITYIDSSDTAEEYKVEQKARVWEIWSKTENLVVWIHPNATEVLDIDEPHLDLDGFYPCAEVFGICEPGTLIPCPDPLFYKDQLDEIDELTARISALSESLKLVGFYAAGSEDLGTAIETALKAAERDNRRIAVPLAGMSSFGGEKLKDAIVWLPVVEVATTVRELVALRKQLIDDVYQISGISDIMRGQSEASETLGAQQLKSQYGSIRIKDRQSEMVRLCDSVLNIAGEIMAENFSPQTILEMSQTELPAQAEIIQQHQQQMEQEIQAAIAQVQQGMQQGQPPPDAQQIEQAKQAIVAKHQKEIAAVVTVEQVFGLLQAQRMRPFVLQIATDSTIQPDENAEKASRSEFAMAFAQMSGALGPLMQVAPKEAAPLSGAMLKFVLAPFRAGREMEQVIEEFVEQMTEKAQQPPPPDPAAEELKMKADLEMKRLDADVAAKTADMDDKKAERAEKLRAATEQAALKRDETMAAAADRQAEREHKLQIAAAEKEAKAIDLEMKRLERDLKAVEASLRRIEANAKVEEVADRKEDRKFNASQRAVQTDEDYRAKKVANDRDQMDLEDRQEERQVRRKKSAMMDDEARRVAEDEEMNRQAVEQLAALDQKIEQIAQGLQMVASTQQMLERSITAEKEVVRDPKTGRATGVRLKQANGAR
jgi:hypothetical protein